MSGNLSRRQILKITGSFIAGVAATRSLSFISDEPAQAQTIVQVTYHLLYRLNLIRQLTAASNLRILIVFQIEFYFLGIP